MTSSGARAVPAIETRQLMKRFRPLRGYRDLLAYGWRKPDIVALDGIDLEIEGGELYGLLGQNGAGKTTLIRILCTTLLPTSGTARVTGRDVVAEPRAVRRVIGLVGAEERSFYHRLSGRRNLLFFATLFGVPTHEVDARCRALISLLGLDDAADRPFATLSSGMRQKFGIARGLLTQPAVLFLDEPTRSLDPIAADGVRRFVRERVVDELGTTVVLATHDLREAEELCDRIAFIRAGRLVAEGTPDELRRGVPAGAGAEILVRGDAQPLVDAIRGVARVSLVDARASRTGETTIRARFGDVGAQRELLAVTAGAGVDVVAYRTLEPTLEEVYLRLLGADRAQEESVAAGAVAATGGDG